MHLRNVNNYLGGGYSLLDTFGVENQMARRAFIAVSEERAHSLGTESPRCVLGHIMRVDIFVNDEKAFADGQIDD